MEKLCIKFSALNVDFDGPSLDFLGSRKPAHKGIKDGTPVKVILPMPDRHGHAAYHNKY